MQRKIYNHKEVYKCHRLLWWQVHKFVISSHPFFTLSPNPTSKAAGMGLGVSLRGLQETVHISTWHNHARIPFCCVQLDPDFLSWGCLQEGLILGGNHSNSPAQIDKHDSPMFISRDVLCHQAVNLNKHYDWVPSCKRTFGISEMTWC